MKNEVRPVHSLYNGCSMLCLFCRSVDNDVENSLFWEENDLDRRGAGASVKLTSNIPTADKYVLYTILILLCYFDGTYYGMALYIRPSGL